MAPKILLVLVANLVLIRLALASSLESGHQDPASSSNSSSEPQLAAPGGSSVLDTLNSLDYSPGAQPGASSSSGDSGGVEQAPTSHTGGMHQTTGTSGGQRQGKSAASRQKEPKSAGSIAHLLVSLLQLDKADMRRAISESLAHLARSAPDLASELVRISRWPSGKRANGPTGASNSSSAAVSQQRDKEKRANASALAAETGNLLSITRQLVKLARGQVMGEYGQPYSWAWPFGAPSMLPAGSHMFHEPADFTGASLKSDWFWVVAPAVIVIGAGVIVIPLIGAWLVSHMMNQNTLTVSAGRRRRRRQVGADGLPAGSVHPDLARLLDIHRLLDDAPELLVDKLSKLHRALDSVGSGLLGASLAGAGGARPGHRARAG